MTTVVLTSEKHRELVASVLPGARLAMSVEEIRPLPDCLIGFNTGVIVPANLLMAIDLAFNFHGAPPEYPGRDPHHWAVYDGAEEYGATAHWMWPSVDAGPIIGTIRFGVAPSNDPQVYRRLGEDAAAMLFRSLAARISDHGAPSLPVAWGRNKRSRRGLISMLDFRELDAQEIARRKRAFAGFEAHFIEAA